MNAFFDRFLDKEMELTQRNACAFLYERDTMRCYIEAVNEFIFQAYQEVEEALEELEEESKTTDTTDGEEDKAV